ncbi:MAG: hypothetical protein ACOX1U_00285 [Saccharofermentanales bacterium]|jgi:L-lactate dehydrogenase|nr:hypothetical protein [Clostridiaceae bacterium]
MREFNIDMKNMHTYIFGEHSESQFPAWSFSRIVDFSINDYCIASGVEFTKKEKLEMAEKTRQAGTDRTVACVLEGEYGLHDVVVSVPCIVGSEGVEKILEVQLQPDELELLHKSAASVRSVIDFIKNV